MVLPILPILKFINEIVLHFFNNRIQCPNYKKFNLPRIFPSISLAFSDVKKIRVKTGVCGHEIEWDRCWIWSKGKKPLFCNALGWVIVFTSKPV